MAYSTGSWFILTRFISPLKLLLSDHTKNSVTVFQVPTVGPKGLQTRDICLYSSFGWGKRGKVTAAGWQVTL